MLVHCPTFGFHALFPKQSEEGSWYKERGEGKGGWGGAGGGGGGGKRRGLGGGNWARVRGAWGVF